MPGEAVGEYISLVWEECVPDAVFVRGHITPEAACEVIEQHHDGDLRHATPEPAWARWSCEPGPDGCGQVLRDYDTPGRGRFAVMRAQVLAQQVDPYSWEQRRNGQRRDWKTRQMVSNTKPGEECDCSHWSHETCDCAGEPKGPQPAWYRRGDK